MSRNLRSLAFQIQDLAREEGKHPRMLVVESRRAACERIRHELHRLGCATMEARTPLETINLLEVARASVHAVVIGPSLTQTRADELASFLEEAYPDLPVLIVDDSPKDTSHDRTDRLAAAARHILDSCLPPAPGATAC